MDKINWSLLSSNPAAITLLESNMNKINWTQLSGNPSAIELLKKHQHRISWNILNTNPNAGEIIESNKHKINWFWISKNPCIFEIDYQKLSERIEVFHEELIQKCFHPQRLWYYITNYGYDIGEDEQFQHIDRE